MKKIIISLILFATFSHLNGQIINVPSDYSNIQEAINNSDEGDTILVSEGTYKENLKLNNKNIVLCSKYIESQDNEYIKNTIIDGNNKSSAIAIEQDVDSTTNIIGFTIINGKGKEAYFEDHGFIWDTVYYGGGIYIDDSCCPNLSNLIIKNNVADYGGGIAIKGGTAKIENTIVMNNNSTRMGGGIFFGSHYKGLDIISSVISNNISERGGGIDYMSGFFDKRLYIKDTEISRNTSTYKGQYGYESGGALHGGNTHVILENVTLFDNKGLTDFCLANYFLEISNSIIWNNKISLFSQHGDSIPTLIEYSDVENGQNNLIISGYNTLAWGDGNINLYPDFTDTSSINLYLLDTSPCLDAGNPNSNYNDSDNSRNDMGAYEFSKTNSVIKYESNTSNVKIYPNPAQDFIGITVLNCSNYTADLFDLNGKKQLSVNLSSSNLTIDISQFEKGIFIIIVRSKNKILGYEKIIKE